MTRKKIAEQSRYGPKRADTLSRACSDLRGAARLNWSQDLRNEIADHLEQTAARRRRGQPPKYMSLRSALVIGAVLKEAAKEGRKKRKENGLPWDKDEFERVLLCKWGFKRVSADHLRKIINKTKAAHPDEMAEITAALDGSDPHADD